MGIYDAKSFEVGNDLVIPNRTADFPPMEAIIQAVELRKTRDGGEFPCLTLKNAETGKLFDVPAWERDVKSLAAEWGADSDAWIGKIISFCVKDKRMIVAPIGETVPVEKVK